MFDTDHPVPLPFARPQIAPVDAMKLMPLLDSLNEGPEPGFSDDALLSRWAVAGRKSPIRANAHRLLLGRELGARLDAMPQGEKGAEVARWMALMGASRSVLFERVSVAREVWSLLAEYPDVALDASILDRPWNEVRGAMRQAVGLTVGTGAPGGQSLAEEWSSKLDMMLDQADGSVESLRELQKKIAATIERVKTLRDQKQAALDAQSAEAVEQGDEGQPR
jgi:hypothetical protein